MSSHPRAQHRLAGTDSSRRGTALRRLCQPIRGDPGSQVGALGTGAGFASQAAHGRAGGARGAGRPARVRPAWLVCATAPLRRLGAAFQRRHGPRARQCTRHPGLCASGVRRARRVGVGQRPGQEPGLHAHQPGGVRLSRQRRIRRFRCRRVARQWRPPQIPLQALWLAGSPAPVEQDGEDGRQALRRFRHRAPVQRAAHGQRALRGARAPAARGIQWDGRAREPARTGPGTFRPGWHASRCTGTCSSSSSPAKSSRR